MAAVELEWIPETLYNTAISAVVDNYIRSRRDIRSLPENIQFDVYYKALMDHGVKVASVLAYSFSRRCSYIAESDAAVKEKAIQVGFVLGGFLSDAGWYSDAEKVFLSCLQLCTLHDEMLHWFRAVECCVRLLHVRNGNCKYHLGEETFKLAQTYMDKLSKHGQQANKAALYGELCALLFAKSHYDEACVVKREFKKAEQLIKHAVYLARDHFGSKHPKYSDTLLDYGFYLLNVDNICQSVAIYQEAEEMHIKAIQIKEQLLGQEDYEVALSVGHLASLYNYDMNQFENAEKLYLRSIAIGKKLFGEGYSGLEYDYRGLIKLYNSIGNYEKVFEYHNVLSNWNRLRDRQYSVTDALEDVNTSPQSTEEVVQSFLISQNVEGPSC
ncbi:amyloid protein-binding protein 2 [Camelus ferus]|nr:amyloid protein-binding protein 2 [Camelus ferus]